MMGFQIGLGADAFQIFHIPLSNSHILANYLRNITFVNTHLYFLFLLRNFQFMETLTYPI